MPRPDRAFVCSAVFDFTLPVYLPTAGKKSKAKITKKSKKIMQNLKKHEKIY